MPRITNEEALAVIGPNPEAFFIGDCTCRPLQIDASLVMVGGVDDCPVHGFVLDADEQTDFETFMVETGDDEEADGKPAPPPETRPMTAHENWEQQKIYHNAGAGTPNAYPPRIAPFQ